MTEPRANFLERILGLDKSKQVDSELSAIAQQLDKAGVARKQFDNLAEKGVIEDLHTDFMTALGKVTDSPDEAIASEMIALAMGRLLQAPVEEEVMAEDEPMIEDDMIEEEAMVDEEFRSLSTKGMLIALHEQLEQRKELDEAVKAYADESTQLVTDMSEIAEALLPALKMVAQLQPVIKNLEGLKADDLNKRVADLEARIKSRPRQASSAPETATQDKTTDKLKAKNLDDVPEIFQSAFKQE